MQEMEILSPFNSLYSNAAQTKDSQKPSSAVGERGKWSEMMVECDFNSPSAIHAVQIRSAADKGNASDDTGLNNLNIECIDAISYTTYRRDGNGLSGGEWSDWVKCPVGAGICGLKTQLHEDDDPDQTGLNGIEFMCCKP